MSASLISLAGICISLYSVLAFIHVLLHSQQSQGALGWAVAVLTIPFFGATAYFLFGINRIDSRASKLMLKAEQKRKIYIKDEENPFMPKNIEEGLADKENFTLLYEENPALFHVGRQKGTQAQIFGNNFKVLYNGDKAYPVMLKAIEEAQNEVYLSSYIFSGKVVGVKFAQALLDAHNRGVEVRVLIDGLSAFFDRDPSLKHLESQGVKVALFLPPRLLPPQMSINLRNHRKLLICDSVGFTGGMNISDGHDRALQLKLGTPKNQIQDVHFLCEGPIVMRLRETFLMDWAFVTEEYSAPKMLSVETKGTMIARSFIDSPGGERDTILAQLCGVCSCAKNSVKIVTPYFLPPRELKSALFSAVARGVDVQIILPQELDHKYFTWASTHIWSEYLEAGVKVYLQPPPFAHTKLLLIDDLYTCIGSTNLDPRSLALNFELNIEVFSKELNEELKNHIEQIICASKLVTLAELSALPLLIKLRNASTWLVSPYL